MMSNLCILFVDNDPAFLETRTEFLELEGYSVQKSYSLNKTRDALLNRHLHLIILDIRMVDDDDEKDLSGLTLAEELAYRPIPKIILTNFPTYQATRDALGPALDSLPPAVDFIAKQEGPDAMLAAVERAFTNHVRINWDLPIRFTQPSSFTHLTNLIDPDIPAERLVERAAELEDLFRKLFYANEQITIGRVLRQGAAQIEVEVYAYGGDEHRGQFVVSCGKRERIEEEKKRYKKGSPGDTDIGSTDLATHKETMRFGAIAYRLMGGDELEDMEPLAVYYQRHDADDVKRMLDHLYNGSLTIWHNTEHAYAVDANIQSLYLRWLGLDKDNSKDSLAKKIKALCSHALHLVHTQYSDDLLEFHLEPDKAQSYPNPIDLLFDKPIEFKQPVLQGVTHGRVDARSVLVDRSGRTWLIGFRHAEVGPLLRDFVYLEDALVAHFVRGMTLSDFYTLEQRLINDVTDLSSSIPTNDLTYDQSKLITSVMNIRHLAAKRAGDDLQLYFIGLLAVSLAHINDFDSNVQYYSNRELIPYIRSLLRAAMLAEKLIQPVQKNIPADLPDQARTSLWIDNETGQVWVEGEAKNLTPQELQLLKYFYQNQGKLCTKKQILAEGLDDPSELYLVRSKLDNAISRLRKKIEPNIKKPKYLKTVHGRGFRFEL